MKHALIRLYIHDPDALVLNAEAPTFALYEDGTVLLQRRANYFSEFTRFVRRLTGAEQGPTPEFLSGVVPQKPKSFLLRTVSGIASAQDRYDLSYEDRGCHQPRYALHVSTETIEKQVVIFGDYGKSPPNVYRAMTACLNFSEVNGLQPWLPEKIEVMLTPFEHAKLPPIQWPQDWPDLTESTSVLNKGPNILAQATDAKDLDCFSLFLSSNHLTELKALYEKCGLHPIQLCDKNFSLAYRFPFPHEQTEITPEYQQKVTEYANQQLMQARAMMKMFKKR